VGEPDFESPYPVLTKWAMGSVPFAFIGMGAIMSGIYWVVNRRQRINKENKENENEEN
jgi:hypothetical protein